MAAHRIWRLRSRGITSQTVVAEVEMADTPGGPDLCTGGSPIANGSYGGALAPSSAFDDNLATRWGTADGSRNAYIGYDFVTPVEINEVRIAPSATEGGECLKWFYVESSDDAATWTTEWCCYNSNTANSFTSFPRPADGTSARFWAVEGLGNQNSGFDAVLADVALHATPGGPNVATGGTGYYYPVNGSYPEANGWDQNPATITYSNTGANPHNTFWWYDLGVGNSEEVVEVKLTAANDGTNFVRAPSEGSIWASDDGLSWFYMGSILAEEWTNGSAQTFEVSAAPPVLSYVSQGTVFGAALGSTPQLSMGTVFAAANFPAEFTQASQAAVVSTVLFQVEAQVAQSTVFALGRGRIANPRVRSWTFTLDGHDFYVLRLGDRETLIYDVYSEQWVEWTSSELPFWRPSAGMNWIGAQSLAEDYGSSIVVGDDTYGLLWFLDPEQPYDENPDYLRTPQQFAFPRIVTGQVLAKGRQFLPCYAVFLEGDNYGLTGVDFTPQVKLETSDDQGRTFDDQGTITVPIDYNQALQYEWLSLGQISEPGRIFRFTDNGVFARIDGAEMNDDGG